MGDKFNAGMLDAHDVVLHKLPTDPSYASIKDASTSEVLHMMLGLSDDDDIEVIGRMPVGMDESEFDAMPPDSLDSTGNEDEMEVDLFNEPDTVMGSAARKRRRQAKLAVAGDGPAPFAAPSPVAKHFPRFTAALAKYKAKEPKSRVVRIDNDTTFGAFVAESAVRELDRRIHELRSLVEHHASDGHGVPAHQLRKWDDIIGSAQLVEDLRTAPDANAAADALPTVDADVPDFAKDHVKCWRDGDAVIVSLRFGAADGTPRMATMAAKPRADENEVASHAMRAGLDPAVVLGALPELMDRAVAKKLVKDVAGAALKAQRRLDVTVMGEEPVILVGADGTKAPVAALMDLQQQAEAGDPQAQAELAKLHAVSQTPQGKQFAAALMADAKMRLEGGRALQAKKQTYGQKYAALALYL